MIGVGAGGVKSEFTEHNEAVGIVGFRFVHVIAGKGEAELAFRKLLAGKLLGSLQLGRVRSNAGVDDKAVIADELIIHAGFDGNGIHRLVVQHIAGGGGDFLDVIGLSGFQAGHASHAVCIGGDVFAHLSLAGFIGIHAEHSAGKQLAIFILLDQLQAAVLHQGGIGNSSAAIDSGDGIDRYLDIFILGGIQFIASGGRDFLHIIGAHRHIFQGGSTVGIGGRHLGQQGAVGIVHTEHSAGKQLAAVRSVSLGQGDGTHFGLGVQNDAAFGEPGNIAAQNQPDSIAFIHPGAAGTIFIQHIPQGCLGFFEPILLAGFQPGGTATGGIGNKFRDKVRIVTVRIDAEFSSGQRSIASDIAVLILYSFALDQVNLHTAKERIGKHAVFAIAQGGDGLVSHNGHFNSFGAVDLITTGGRIFLHIVGAGLQFLGSALTVGAGGNGILLGLAGRIGIHAEHSAGQGSIAVRIHLGQGDIAADSGIGHGVAVLGIAGVGHPEAVGHLGFFHSVIVGIAVGIILFQAGEGAGPVGAAGQGEGLAAHYSAVLIQLHGHIGQRGIICRTGPYLGHLHFSDIIGVVDHIAVHSIASDAGNVAVHSHFLHGVGIGSAVGINPGQVGKGGGPVIAAVKGKGLALQDNVILQQLHSDAGRTCSLGIFVPGPGLAHGNGNQVIGIGDGVAVLGVAGDGRGVAHHTHFLHSVGVGSTVFVGLGQVSKGALPVVAAVQGEGLAIHGSAVLLELHGNIFGARILCVFVPHPHLGHRYRGEVIGVGNGKAALGVAGDDAVITINSHFGDGVGIGSAAYISLGQVGKGAVPVVAAVQGEGLALHEGAVLLELHRYIRQLHIGRYANPNLGHRNGYQVVGIGDGVAVLGVAGDDAVITINSHFGDGVGIGSAGCIGLGQAGEASLPVVAAVQGEGHAIHGSAVLLELHGYIRQLCIGRIAAPHLLHGHGHRFIGVGNGKAGRCRAGDGSGIAGNGGFGNGIGIGSAVIVLLGQFCEGAGPVIAAVQGEGFAGHVRAVLLQLHGDAFRAGVIGIVIVPGPHLGDGNIGKFAFLEVFNIAFAVGAVDPVGLPGGDGKGQGIGQQFKAFRRHHFLQPVVAGLQAINVQPANVLVHILGVEHFCRKGVGACFIQEHLEAGAVELDHFTVLHIRLVQLHRTGIGLFSIHEGTVVALIAVPHIEIAVNALIIIGIEIYFLGGTVNDRVANRRFGFLDPILAGIERKIGVTFAVGYSSSHNMLRTAGAVVIHRKFSAGKHLNRIGIPAAPLILIGRNLPNIEGALFVIVGHHTIVAQGGRLTFGDGHVINGIAQFIIIGCLGFLHIIGAHRQLNRTRAFIIGGKGGYLVGAGIVGIDGEFRIGQLGIGIFAVHLGNSQGAQGHLGIGHHAGVLHGFHQHGFVLLHVYLHRGRKADFIAKGSFDFLYPIFAVVQTHRDFTGAVGGVGANQGGLAGVKFCAGALAVDFEHGAFQLHGGIAILHLHQLQGAAALEVLNIALGTHQSGHAGGHLHGVHLIAGHITGLGLGFLHIIGAGCQVAKGNRAGVLISLGRVGQTVLGNQGGAGGIGIQGEFHIMQQFTGGAVLFDHFNGTGFHHFVPQHVHPGGLGRGGHGALVDFGTVFIFNGLGNGSTVGRAARHFDMGTGGKQGAAVLRSGIDGAFKGLVGAAFFIQVDKVEQHTVGGAAVFLPPLGLVRLAGFIDIHIQRIGQHIHIAVLGGADHIEHRIFIGGDHDLLLADGLLQIPFVKIPVIAQGNIVQRNNIAVFIFGAGNGGVAQDVGVIAAEGTLGIVVLHHAALHIAQFFREGPGLFQQLSCTVAVIGGGNVQIILYAIGFVIESPFAVPAAFIADTVFKLGVLRFAVGIGELDVDIRITPPAAVIIIILFRYINKIAVAPHISGNPNSQPHARAQFDGGIMRHGVVIFQGGASIIQVAHHAADIAAGGGGSGYRGAVMHFQLGAVFFSFVHNGIGAVGIHFHLTDIKGLQQILAVIGQFPAHSGHVGIFFNGEDGIIAHSQVIAVMGKQRKLHPLEGFPVRCRYGGIQRICLAVHIGSLRVQKRKIAGFDELVHKHTGFGVVALGILLRHHTVIQCLTKTVENVIDRQLLDHLCPGACDRQQAAKGQHHRRQESDQPDTMLLHIEIPPV